MRLRNNTKKNYFKTKQKCGIFVQCVKICYCDWFNKELTVQQIHRMYRQDFQAKRREVGDEHRHASDTNKTWKKSNIQNERKVKATRQNED